MPVNLQRQERKQGNTKFVSYFNSREQPGNFREKYPNNNFSTVRPTSTNDIPIDSAQRADKNETLQNLQISF
jgi:hypothetical protein